MHASPTTPSTGHLARPHFLARFGLATLLGLALPGQPGAQEVSTYSGPCDTSAAVALDGDHFVAGNDETDTLHIYRRGQAQAVGRLDLSSFLGTRPGEESDIEGAAAIGARIYWITSHGSNSKGKTQPSRQRFFATALRPGVPPTLEPFGEAYTQLLHDLAATDALKPYKLDDAARRPPEAKGGLNIEGLAATPDGRLLIGLRNPLPQGRALVIPLDNPAEVVQGQRAKFGAAIELDLDRRGIRSLELVGSSYLIVAGPPDNGDAFALYRWSGAPGAVARRIDGVDLRGLRPEAMFALAPGGSVQLLSDDGGVKVGGAECKKLPLGRQSFRTLVVKP